jgi:hypothetical protein
MGSYYLSVLFNQTQIGQKGYGYVLMDMDFVEENYRGWFNPSLANIFPP